MTLTAQNVEALSYIWGVLAKEKINLIFENGCLEARCSPGAALNLLNSEMLNDSGKAVTSGYYEDIGKAYVKLNILM